METDEEKYRGYLIRWPKVRIDTRGYVVELSSDDPHLLARFGGLPVKCRDFDSLEGAIQQAKQHVDYFLDVRVI
jgi:hypothetical protein